MATMLHALGQAHIVSALGGLAARSDGIGSPLTSSWPHLRCDVGLEEGEYK